MDAHRLQPLDTATSYRLSKVRQTGTRPEKMLARECERLGLELVTPNPALPGRPDFTHPDSRVAVFVDGCFWHGHRSCYRQPVSNVEYWRAKLRRNRARRRIVKAELQRAGWTVVECWECAIKKNAPRLAQRVARVIQGTPPA